MIFCATDGVRALALLEVLHFISPRRGRLCSRRNARSFSPPGLVGRCVGCAGTFRFIFVAREPLFPVIFGLERALGPFSFSHSVARGAAALLGRKKKEKKRKAASPKPKARIVALLELISVDDSRSRGRDILFHRQRGETKKKSESPELVSRGERSKVGRHVGSLALPRRLRFLGRL